MAGLMKKGFTLIETLVVVVCLILVLVSGSSLFLSSIIGSLKVSALKEVRQNGQYALKTMEDLIKNSQGLVSCSGGVFPTDTSPPKIIVKDSGGNQTTLTLIEDGGHYKIASESSGLTYFLTSSKVNIDHFQVDCSDILGSLSEGVPPTVSLNFTLSQGNLETDPKYRTAQMTFNSTVTLRIPFKQVN